MNYDNYEWLMFELLEGNLSEQDELKVIKQIEEDEFFFKEWKLFKQTKIHKDDAIIFPNKLSLLKPISQAPVRTVPVFGIAASIVIAVMIGIFWPSVLPDSETISTVQNLSEQQKITPKSTNDIQLTKSNTPRNSSVKAEQLFLPNSNIDVSKLSYRHETRITEEFFSDAPIKLHEQINIEYIDVSQPVWIDSLDGSISVLEDNISVAQSTSKPKSVDSMKKNDPQKINEVEIHKYKNEEPKYLVTNWFNLKAGWTNWLNSSGNLDADGNYPMLELNPANSYNLQVNIVEQSLKLFKDRFRLTYGLGSDNYYYNLKNDISISNDQNGLLITDDSETKDFKKNWLYNSYITVPLMFNVNFASQKNKEKDIYFASVVNFMYSMSSVTKQKWKDGDTKYKSRAKKDLGLNQFNIGYEAQLGYKNLILYVKYIPGGIFKSSSRPDLRSLSFGVVIGDVFN